MPEPEYDKISIMVGGERVILDPENLKFDETTLGSYLDHEGSWYDYFGRALANAEAELSAAKELSDVVYMRAFDAYKSEGSSDKRAEAQARIEQPVIDSRQAALDADKSVKLLKQHLKSWDKGHEAALNRGYNLRKELELTGNRIYGKIAPHAASPDDYEQKLQQIIRPVKTASKEGE